MADVLRVTAGELLSLAAADPTVNLTAAPTAALLTAIADRADLIRADLAAIPGTAETVVCSQVAGYREAIELANVWRREYL